MSTGSVSPPTSSSLSDLYLEFPTTGATPPYIPSSPLPTPPPNSNPPSPEPIPNAEPVPPNSLQSRLYSLYLDIHTLILENEPEGIREPSSPHITIRVLWYALDKLYNSDSWVATLRALPKPLFEAGEIYMTFFVERLEPALLRLQGNGGEEELSVAWTAEKYIRTLANGIGGRWGYILERQLKGTLLPELVTVLVICLRRLIERLVPIMEVVEVSEEMNMENRVRVRDRVDRLVGLTHEMVGSFFAERLVKNERAQRLICGYLEEDLGDVGAEINGTKLDEINDADEWGRGLWGRKGYGWLHPEAARKE